MRRTLTLLIMLSLILLTACGGNQLVDNKPNWTIPIDDGETARPTFNRTYDPSEWEYPDNLDDDEPIDPAAPNQSVFLVRHEAATQFRIPIGTALGDAYPVIDRDMVPLLRPAPMMTGDNHFRSYKQFIRFAFDENSTGNVTFILDEDRDYLGTALVFQEEYPLMEYALFLDSRPFFDPAVLGSAIMLLGNSFQVQEATNLSLQLNGLDVEQYLQIQDGEPLKSTRKRITNTLVRYDGFGFIYRIFTRDIDSQGLVLREGESLRDRLADDLRLEAIPGVYFDLRYDGLEPVNPELNVPITFKGKDERVELEWESAGTTVTIPLLGYNDQGVLWHGDDDNRLHLAECNSIRDGCIKVDDEMLLFGRVPDDYNGEPTTRILRLTGIDPEERKIVFRDEQNNRISTDWYGRQQTAELPYLDRTYRIWVINTTVDTINGTNITAPTSISMDLDGAGGVRGEPIDLYLADGLRAELGDLLEPAIATADEPYILNVTFETLPFRQGQQRYKDGRISKELVRVQLVADDGIVRIRVPTNNGKRFLWDQVLYEEPVNEDFALGLSQWGTQVILEEDRSSGVRTQETTDDVTLQLPLVQRFALISIGKLE